MKRSRGQGLDLLLFLVFSFGIWERMLMPRGASQHLNIRVIFCHRLNTHLCQKCPLSPSTPWIWTPRSYLFLLLAPKCSYLQLNSPCFSLKSVCVAWYSSELCNLTGTLCSLSYRQPNSQTHLFPLLSNWRRWVCVLTQWDMLVLITTVSVSK